jgi:hypothetical protein
MRKKLCYALMSLLIFAFSAFAQETTAGLQGVVKDSSGAVISRASVEVRSATLIGEKKLTTDGSGYYHFTNLPPGEYTLIVDAPGFSHFQQVGILLETGHLPTVDAVLKVGSAAEIVEVTGEAALVDVTQSKVQTNVTADILENVPKGRSFQTVIQFAPGARTEPLDSTSGAGGIAASGNNANGFQIHGASNSENSYLVEGQETASPFDGHSKANVPMEFIQEVQVKTEGFEAEYGGALGGVVNVIQARGSNIWHGSVFTIYSGDAFNAAPNPSLIRNPQVKANAGGALRLDQPAEYYQPTKDQLSQIIPGFTLGGPLLKDKLSTFISFAPEFDTLHRTVNFAPTAPVPGARTFTQTDNTYYTYARLDYAPFERLRVFGSWTYAYERLQGSSLPQADSAFGQFNTSSTNNVDNYNNGLAIRYPNSVYNFGGDVTINNHTVATTRFGLFKFDNGQTTGTPVGIQYTYRDTNYPYSTGNAPAPSSTTALNGSALPSQFVNSTGYSNIGGNTATVYDAWKDYNFNQDISYFRKMWGTHTFKVGYGFRKSENNILSGYNTSDVYVAYNDQYFPQTSGGFTNCNAIIAQNQANYGNPGGTPNSKCQGLWGTVNIRELGTTGKVGGWNHSLYFQDGWTVAKGVTLNLGVRLDKESLPSYNTLPGFNGIDFGWGQKVAPRLGVAWDVLGNGKLKAFGSYGKFFDIMKLQLPRGSFGGDYWHDCVYALDTPDYTQIIPQRDSNGHYCPLGGGTTPANGTFPANGLRFIENVDYRQPANDPNSFGTLGATGLVDPNLKPMEQHQMTAGADWEISQHLGLETTYTRIRLDRTIEDAGILTPNGEQYYIVNPGFGINTTVPSFECTGCPPNPPAARRYDSIDVRLTRRAAAGLNGALSYSWSKLWGNYSGLTATDISDGQGRNGANTDRAFDEPFMSFDAHGRVIDGPLATDRPNTFKAYGYYPVKWLGMTTDVGIYQYVYQGTPLSTYLSVSPGGAPVFVEGRGKTVQLTRDPATGNIIEGAVSDARTPIFANTDFNLTHEFPVSKTNERLRLRLEANIANIFNQHSPLVVQQNQIRTGTITPAKCSVVGGCPATNQSGSNYAFLETKPYDYIGALNTGGVTLSSLYGLTSQFQTPRNMRFKIAFTF